MAARVTWLFLPGLQVKAEGFLVFALDVIAMSKKFGDQWRTGVDLECTLQHRAGLTGAELAREEIAVVSQSHPAVPIQLEGLLELVLGFFPFPFAQEVHDGQGGMGLCVGWRQLD